MKRLSNTPIPKYQSPLEMRQQAKQAGRKKYIYRRISIFLGVFGVVMLIMVGTLIKQAITLHQKNEEKIALQEKLQTLREREILLNEEIIRLGDDEYIAKLARKDYFLSQENEIIFNLPEEK